jgi:RimJ/RimL family protein N-acetyltransferase
MARAVRVAEFRIRLGEHVWRKRMMGEIMAAWTQHQFKVRNQINGLRANISPPNSGGHF